MSREDRLKLAELQERVKIEEAPKARYEKPKGFKAKLSNFFYHYKWQLIGAIFAVAIFAFALTECFNKVKYDYRIIIVANFYLAGEDSKLVAASLTENAADINHDGKVNISVESINLDSGDTADMQAAMAGQVKLMAELSMGEVKLYIFDDAVNSLVFEQQGIFLLEDGAKNYFLLNERNSPFKGTVYEDLKLYMGLVPVDKESLKTDERRAEYEEYEKIYNKFKGLS
ncbi:MAG: hypothetical protein LBC56_03080 [Oscillospiraceae bacterium]|jgi:hypothetical protein|nr:hypothetical protein [Oscillospiraceae bacterium]